VLLPLLPFDNEDAVDGTPLAKPSKDDQALEGVIIVGGEIIFIIAQSSNKKNAVSTRIFL
jgi:hypothetical protein